MWESFVKEVLDESLLSDEGESPPGGGDEVPDGVSTGGNGASSGVKTEDLVFGEVGSHHLESDVDGTGGDGNTFSNELLETGIGIWDGNTFAFYNDF